MRGHAKFHLLICIILEHAALFTSPSMKMAPTVILIRHAEALHNTSNKNYTIHDPPLTDRGYGPQCQALSQFLQHSFPLAQDISLIVVSPMQRTLQTADQALGWLMKRGVPAIVLAEWQETTVNKCDIGRPITQISAEWPQFDWSEIDPKFPAKEGLYEFSQAALIKRGIVAKRWLKARPEKVIVVVSHAGFLRTGICNRKFDNADFRVFEFEDGEEVEGEGPRLVESDLTAKTGGGMGKSPDGFFGWEENDFKYMPENSAQEQVVKA